MPPFFKALTALHLVAAAMIWLVMYSLDRQVRSEPQPRGRVVATLQAIDAPRTATADPNPHRSQEPASQSVGQPHSARPARRPDAPFEPGRRVERAAPWDADTGRSHDARDAVLPWRTDASGRISLRY